MKTNKLYKLIVPLLFLAGSIGVAWGQGTEPVKEDKYLKLDLPYSNITFINPGDNIEEKFDGNNISGLYDHSTSTWYKYNNGVLPEITFTFQKKETVSAIAIQSGVSENAQPTKVVIQWSADGTSWNEGEEHDINPITPTNGENPIYSISLNELRETQYLKLTLSPQSGTDKWVTVQDIWIYVLPTIKHKYAKWHDQRGSAKYDDDFDGTEWFNTKADWRPGIEPRKIQATHTYIDTIYAHRGSTVKLTLPDHLNNDISIQSYQRWYSFRTGRTFATQYNNDESGNEEERIVDLLTPTVENFYYRLANGYVGSPISEWAQVGNSGDICSMNFYFPTEEQFKQMFPNYETDEAIDNDWYVVACDVSGYTDYTETFDETNSKNTTFGADGEYYEPTLSHRVIFYIHAADDNESWYNKAWENNDTYLEEYEINMPFTRYVDKTFEVVALSKDARSYMNPDGTDDVKLTVTIDDNEAGIKLQELTGNTNEGHMKQEDGQWVISGENRVISFDYPTDKGNGTKQVNDEDGDGHSSATIIVRKGEKNIARFKLNFIKGTSLMTQSMIKALNDQRDGITGGTKVDEDWDYPERTPQYMEKNYEFLTGLDFNFKGANAWQNIYYPYPLAWDHCSYAFFDGSTGAYFKGGTYPEWGYYSIMNKYLECANPSSDQDTWGWQGHMKANEPNDECMEPRIPGETNLYHMFIDASDRPGIIARLPFDKVLCPGTELFVSAWVKSAKWNQTVDNAAMLFTFMGVTDDGKYVPLYRHQTGQIPATYMNEDIKLPGFAADSNEWFQIAFSFITDENITSEYDSYVLQIENNSASTSGGDMYLDDVRVYMRKVEAEVKQLESTCGNERTRLNFSIDWEQLLSRTGEPDLTPSATGDYDGADGFPTAADGVPFSGIGLCFIDKEKFDNLSSSGEDFDDCVVRIGANDGDGNVNNYQYAAMFYKLDYDKNTSYTEGQKKDDGGALAKNNDWFFYYDEENENRKLTVDFLADIKPYKKYIMMVVPLSAEDLEASLEQENGDMDKAIEYIREQLEKDEYKTQFQDIHGDCAIKTEITVTSQSLIMVNGKVLDPTTDEYCIGQVLNFSVQLQIPNGENEEGEQQYEDFDEEVYFDWFFGTDEEFGIGDNGEAKTGTLAEALETLRNIEEYKNVDETTIENIQPKDGFTQEMQKLIINALGIGVEGGSNAKLVMHRTSLNITLLEGGLDLVVRPIQVSLEDDNAEVCWEPLYFHLDPKGKAPELHPGFHDVNYPGGIEPNLRVGLKQIKEATSNNPIKVNLRGAKPVNEGKNLVKQNENAFVYLINSNDPKVMLDNTAENFSSLYPVGNIVALQAKKDGSANDYMTIYFNETLTKAENNDFVFNPREGYEYLLRIPFQEEEDTESEGQQSICYGSFNLLMKVVPEYQKWIGEATDNWNNDDNWVRSTKDELKKAKDDAYTDYGDEADKPIDREHAGYVPMKFTKVTINTDKPHIELYKSGISQNESGDHPILNLEPKNGTTTAVTGEATENIEYDMLVNPEVKDGVYYCETYYDNTAEQIHFEPKAEMLHAELLKYEKAWVDYKLESNQWHTLASPLQGVVAGDFYTDGAIDGTTITDGVAGTENQEYFTDITFDGKINGKPSDANNATIENSRFSPSVYQRGWGKKAEMITVGDNGTTSNTVAVQGNWSAVYNNVEEAYTPGTGFSLKVLDMPEGANSDGTAIFRLPKADDSYSYYTNGSTTSGNPVQIDRNENTEDALFKSGQLKTNELTDADATITVPLQENEGSNYYLIGNPFMAHLDAAKFFEDNKTVLEQKYWTVTEDVQNVAASNDEEWKSTDGTDIPTIAPLQSFFVQKVDNATETTVKFTADMQTLAESTSNDEASSEALILTAQTADGKTSRAAIAYDATAKVTYEADEDAELFLDSNLSDVPTIYTVAGTMATSINRTSELYNIPVGIYGNSTEMVTLSVSGVNGFSSATLYDAEEKTETPLREGTTLTIPASTSGRYFLRAGTPTANEVIETSDIQIYTLSSNRVMVTSNVPLKDIRVYTMNGAQVKHTKAGVCSFELYLADGIYLITAQNTNGETQTEKVVVR